VGSTHDKKRGIWGQNPPEIPPMGGLFEMKIPHQFLATIYQQSHFYQQAHTGTYRHKN
jgi:hypothetical protein